jgi:glycosyltransferase involved in cell wall biosynthesis
MADVDVAVSLVPDIPVLRVATATKLVEYLAMGKPVVANEHPDHLTVLRDSGAGYCVPLDVGAFAAAITDILDSATTAECMAKAGPIYVAEHRNYAKMAKAVAAVYFERCSH